MHIFCTASLLTADTSTVVVRNARTPFYKCTAVCFIYTRTLHKLWLEPLQCPIYSSSPNPNMKKSLAASAADCAVKIAVRERPRMPADRTRASLISNNAADDDDDQRNVIERVGPAQDNVSTVQFMKSIPSVHHQHTLTNLPDHRRRRSAVRLRCRPRPNRRSATAL